MRNLTKTLATLACAVGCLAAPSAGAYTFNNAGDSVIVDFTGGIPGATLDATITYTLTSFNTMTDTAVLSVFVENDSTGAGVNRLVSFGVINTTPQLTGISDNSSIFATTINSNFPGGVQQVEFCGFSGQNCSGGGNTGLLEDQDHTFSVTLSFAGDITPFLFSGYSARWQAAGSGDDSFVLTGCERGITCDPRDPEDPPVLIPEPGSMALLGLGLLLLGRRIRKA